MNLSILCLPFFRRSAAAAPRAAVALFASVLALALPARADLPRPIVASFSRGALLEVAGYDANKSALAGFPVLVRIANDSPSGFSYSQMQSPSDGADLCFVDMDGIGLPFEIDTWDPDGTSLVWVTLPTMEHGTQFVMCWGSTASGKTVCGDNPFAGYYGVWHMNEANARDSSANHLDGTADASVSIVDAKLGTGANFPSDAESSTGITTASTPNSAFASAISFETWACPSVVNEERALFGKEALATFKTKNGTTWFTTPGKQDFDKVNHPVVANTWYHFVVTFVPRQSAKVYVNGELVKTQADGKGGFNNLNLSCPVVIGNNQWPSQYYKGILDECRLLTTELSADWIAASYATQSDPAFLTAGPAETYQATAEPLVGLVAPPSAVLYTNATLTAFVSSLGMDGGKTTDADWVDARLVVSPNADLSAPVMTVPLSRIATVPASVQVPLAPLATNTVYHAQLQATNSLGVAGESDVVSFTTLSPLPPAGSVRFHSRGFTTLTATGAATDLGVGAESATIRLEASADGFETTASSAEIAAVPGQSSSFTVANLAPDTAYALRLRIVNDWGLVTILPLAGTFSTHAAPLAATGIAYAFSADGSAVDFTFGVTEVFDGANGSATLVYDGRTIGTRDFSGPATLSWPGVAAASGTATAKVVATATLPNDGGTFSKEWTLAVVPGATSTVVSDVSAYASAAGALWMRPGDAVLLPELAGVASYQVLNERFASLDGNALTALEPGIVGIRCVDANFTTNIMGVVVLPDPIGEGSIYVFDETKHGNNDNACSWSNPTCWRKVGSDTNDSYPRNADDIAILPFYSKTYGFVRHNADITIGGLYAGMILPSASVRCVLERFKNVTTKTVTFRRTDGKPVRIQVCPNSEGGSYSTIRLGGWPIDVVWASDAVIDGGSPGTDANGPRGYFEVNAATSTNTLDGVTLTIQGLPGHNTSSSSGSANYSNNGNVGLLGVWKGTGEIVKKGEGAIAFGGDFSGFSGTIRERSSSNLGIISAPAAGVLMRAAGASNVTAHVYGYGAYNPATAAMTYNNPGHGKLGTGGAGVDPAGGSQGPAKGLHLHGGTYRANAIDKTGWGIGGKDEKVFDVLSVGAGQSFITMENGKGNDGGKPINAITIKSLSRTADRGTLAIYDPSCNNAPATTVTNCMFTIQDWADHVVGAEGDNQNTDVYPIVPWILVNRDSSFNGAYFASFDANGRIVMSKCTDQNIDAYGNANANAYLPGRGIGLTADVTVQALFLNNSGKTRTLGAGRTLTVTSGALALYKAGSSIGLDSSPNANGSLVLGDTTHPAYVWTKDNGGSPNEIWATTTAAGGFVKSWSGTLVLGGTQTGIAGEIAVNGGTLQLGNETKNCVLAEGIPIRVCAGATLKLPYADTIATSPLKIDGSGGAFGKVELAANQKCALLAIRDVYESEDWTPLRGGVYGSSASGAEIVRDDLFAGTGTLAAGDAAPSENVMLLIW